MKDTIVIGTRGSALALAQTDIAVQALKSVEPALTVAVKIITTKGDVNQNPIPLDTIGKGWFTKEIEDGLLDGSIDIAVHSLKDMAQELPQELWIGAYLAREDARDVLVTKNGKTLADLPQGAVIGTDSARRQVQMKALHPDVVMQSVRGSVVTRLEKLDAEGGSYDAVILAAAGLKRLGLESRISHYFEPRNMTPAPGQGILALEIKADNTAMRELLKRIDNAEARQAAEIERSFALYTESGCKSPSGAYAYPEDGGYRLIATIAYDDGTLLGAEESSTSPEEIRVLGEVLAKRLLKQKSKYA